MKLNLGCAKDLKPGWINIDLHYIHPDVSNLNILDLEFENNSIDEILARDILEHLPFEEGLKTIIKWYNWLKGSGLLTIQTTNWDKIKNSTENGWDLKTLNHMLFAGPSYIDEKSNECDWHKSIYSLNFMKSYCTEIGFEIIDIEEDSLPWHGNLNFCIKVRK